MNKKSPKRNYTDYVMDIVYAIESIDKFVEGFNFKSFSEDQKTVFAVVKAFEIIGEAVKSIPVTVKIRHKEIPWKKVSDMRNKLIHEYFGVNKKVVWKTIKEDVPMLKDKMSELLDELGIKRLI